MSDLEEFVLGLGLGDDDEMESGDESGPEIEPDPDSDFNLLVVFKIINFRTNLWLSLK